MIQSPAILTGFSTKLDGSCSVRFSTNELSDNDVLELKRHQGKFGFVMFAENEFKSSDIPKENAEDKSKTPSKRLRAVLFVQWKQSGEPSGDFEAFYFNEVEKLINQIKAKLD